MGRWYVERVTVFDAAADGVPLDGRSTSRGFPDVHVPRTCRATEQHRGTPRAARCRTATTTTTTPTARLSPLVLLLPPLRGNTVPPALLARREMRAPGSTPSRPVLPCFARCPPLTPTSRRPCRRPLLSRVKQHQQQQQQKRHRGTRRDCAAAPSMAARRKPRVNAGNPFGKSRGPRPTLPAKQLAQARSQLCTYDARCACGDSIQAALRSARDLHRSCHETAVARPVRPTPPPPPQGGTPPQRTAMLGAAAQDSQSNRDSNRPHSSRRWGQ